MANEEHVEILKQGAKVWNKWREKNRDVSPDLFRANLSKARLNGTNLSGANIIGAESLTKEQIESAITDEDTKLPDDLK